MKPRLTELANALPTEKLLAFGRVQLIALDLDGTAVSSGSDIVLEKIRDQIKALQRKGVRILVATGRTLTKARSILLQLSFDETSSIVVFNGAVETNIEGVDIRIHHLPSASVRLLASYALGYGRVLLLYRFVPARVLQVGSSEEVFGFAPIGERFCRDFNGLKINWLGASPDLIGRFNTALLIGTQRITEVPRPDGVNLTSSGTGYVEVRPEGIDKGTALRNIGKRLGIAREQVLAIGDNDNDCEMLGWAGLSVVPANASPHAKSVASLISAHDEFHCVIETLRLVLDARRFCEQLSKRES